MSDYENESGKMLSKMTKKDRKRALKLERQGLRMGERELYFVPLCAPKMPPKVFSVTRGEMWLEQERRFEEAGLLTVRCPMCDIVMVHIEPCEDNKVFPEPFYMCPECGIRG